MRLAAYQRAPAVELFEAPRNPSHPSAAGHLRLAAEVAALVEAALGGAVTYP